MEPTILINVTPDMAVWQDETFGPVAVVVPFHTDEEAIALNNDTEYGLSSGIITADEHRALEMSRKLETGMCHVNCSSVNDEPHVPFGAAKPRAWENTGEVVDGDLYRNALDNA